MVQTWSQYLQYIFLNKFMKSAEYYYSVQNSGVRGRGVLLLHADWKY
jgi:hypothetical protein